MADAPGLTRDRQYAAGTVGDRAYLAVDTGGLTAWSGPAELVGAPDELAGLMSAQVQQALIEADAIVFLTDGREGLNSTDREVAEVLRRQQASIWVAANKTEGVNPDTVTAEFSELGLGQPYPISAAHGDGVAALMEHVLAALPETDQALDSEEIPAVAVVGRPNVGKSTLVNTVLGEDRVLVFDEPGTTRDSIRVNFEREGRRYGLIDTAGVRRRGRISSTVEKYSVIKTLRAVEAANVVILVLDAQDGVTEQDAMLAGFVLEEGRAIVVAVNKWDAVDTAQRARLKQQLDRKLVFLKFARTHLISARHGTGTIGLFASVDRAFASAHKTLRTPRLNQVLQGAVRATAPPRARGGPIRLKFAHQAGKNPPRVVIHGTRVDAVPGTYRRYLSNAVRAGFGLEGTPVKIEFRVGDNPYVGQPSHGRKGRKKRGKRRQRSAPRLSR